MMAIKRAVDNLKGFVSSRPPIVVFIVFLTSLAVTLISLAFYIRESDHVRDPNIELDWNVFLENFARIDFCVSSNRNGTAFPSYNVSVAQNPEKRREEKATPRLLGERVGFRNFSLSVILTLHPTPEFLDQAQNLTHLSGSIYGFQLGFQGDAAQEELNVTFDLGSGGFLNMSLCKQQGFLGRRCPSIRLNTCVQLSGASPAFPATPLQPDVCVSDSSHAGSAASGAVETHGTITGHREIASKGWGAIPFCPRGPVAHTEFHFDPILTVFLSVSDRSVINLHLLHTSYFLIVMVCTILCYALLKGRNHGERSSERSSSPSLNGRRGNYSLVA